MPLKRKRSVSRARGTMVRTRSVSRSRRARVAPRRKRVSLDFHRFSRYMDGFPVTTTSVSEGFAYSFQLIDVLSYTEFTAMFDQYKIEKVIFRIQLVTNPDASVDANDAGTGAWHANSNNFYPKLWYIRDDDDSTAETLLSIKERVGVKCKVMRPNQQLSIVIRPKIAVQTYKTATASGYAPKRMFVDCSNPEIPHYGLHMCTDMNGLDPVGTFRFRVDVQYFLAFKGVR